MKHGMPWYKHNVHEFLDGVQGIGADTIGAYIVLLDLIYARGGETRRDDRHLAAVLGSSKRLATALTDRLIELGKLEVHGAFITNSRAKSEVKSARTVAERRVNGQRTRRENETTSNENSELEDKNVSLKPPREEKIREDKNKKDPSDHKKGTRIPADFQPDIEWAMREGLTLSEANREVESFRDYWIAKTGKDATKQDWPATWRNWVRNQLKRKRGPPVGGGKSAFRQHQDEVTQSFRDALRGTEYDQSHHDDRHGQPAFDLEGGDFFSDRTASAGKR